MALTLHVNTANTLCNQINTLCTNGWVRIYGADNTTVLAELRFGNPAFQNPVNGSMTVNPITEDSSANASGTATTFRLFQSNGTTEILRGECGTAANPKDLNFDTLTITANQTVRINSLVFTCPGTYS